MPVRPDPSVRPAAYDGDTPAEERDWVRRHSRWIVTNPDMLHRGILPGHQRWSSTLRRVAYVVIDTGLCSPELVAFAKRAFGLTPVAASGLLDLVADLLRGGTEIPLGVEILGVFDNELRCMFAPVDVGVWGALVDVAVSWHRGAAFELVQLLWPDRNGFLPTEAGFDRRVATAQPVVGAVGG